MDWEKIISNSIVKLTEAVQAEGVERTKIQFKFKIYQELSSSLSDGQMRAVLAKARLLKPPKEIDDLENSFITDTIWNHFYKMHNIKSKIREKLDSYDPYIEKNTHKSIRELLALIQSELVDPLDSIGWIEQDNEDAYRLKYRTEVLETLKNKLPVIIEKTRDVRQVIRAHVKSWFH
jgi:hypothetical protein